MPKDNENTKPGFKVVAVAASALLVAALVATGVLAYGQNNTGSNMTALEGQANATGAASTNMTETASSNDTREQDDEETFTASTVADSECSSVITAEDGTVSLNSTTTMTAEELSEEAETMTAGLNDTQVATLDEMIENACDAIRDGKSVTALGFLQSARDILNEAETGTAQADEAEDGDEPGDVDAADEDADSEDKS